MSLENKLIDFICENYQASGVTVETKLIDDGIIDSMGILELVSFIEEECEVSFPDDEITVENFNTIKDILAYVEKL